MNWQSHGYAAFGEDGVTLTLTPAQAAALCTQVPRDKNFAEWLGRTIADLPLPIRNAVQMLDPHLAGGAHDGSFSSWAKVHWKDLAAAAVGVWLVGKVL